MSKRAPATVARMDAVLAVLRDAAGEPISCMACADFTGMGRSRYVETYRALLHLERDGLVRRATYPERTRPVTLPDGRPYDLPPDTAAVEWVSTNRNRPPADDMERAWSLPAAEVER